MPQASEELRAKMIARFGSIGLEGPVAFLESRGFVLNEDYSWKYPERQGPEGRSDVLYKGLSIEEDEAECLNFLLDEWDF